jgi:hypothetical protein
MTDSTTTRHDTIDSFLDAINENDERRGDPLTSTAYHEAADANFTTFVDLDNQRHTVRATYGAVLVRDYARHGETL